MRLRNIKGSREKIECSDFTIQQPDQYKGKWKDLFGNNNPIHIEIGMGKGRFISELAVSNPDINYIGIEKFSSVLIRALEKRGELEISNLFFIRMDAEYINNVFAENEVERIYLNFSDPWPKDRHAKRRLTSKEFFGRYDRMLQKDGIVIFKTDNRELFDFSLEEVEAAGWTVENKTYDLVHSEYTVGNVMTEYEEKFMAEGKPINRLTARRFQ